MKSIVKFFASFYVAIIGGVAVFTDITQSLSLDKIIQSKHETTAEWIISITLFLIFIFAQRHLHADDKKNLKRADLFRHMYKSLTNPEIISGNDGENLSPERIMNTLLRRIFDNNLNFETTERVSVYKYDDNDKKIYRIGRHCPCAELSGQGKRVLYESEKGVIGKAFHQKADELVIRNAPCPEDDFEKYKAFLDKNEVGLASYILMNIRMKSRAYWVFRTKDNCGHNSGLILFESTRPNAFSFWISTKNRRKLKKMLQSEEGLMLLEMIKERRMPSENRERGL